MPTGTTVLLMTTMALFLATVATSSAASKTALVSHSPVAVDGVPTQMK